MGLRFRKSIKIGKHAKFNLSKKSVGLSLGDKHGRVSINSKGRKTTSVGIPGTGLSYLKSSKIGGNEKKSKNNNSNLNLFSTSDIDSPKEANKKQIQAEGCCSVRLAVIFLVILVAFSVLRSCVKSDIDVNTTAKQMTADQFAALFIDNADEAEKENKDKIFEITGTVDKMSKYSYKIDLQTSQKYNRYQEFTLNFDFEKNDYKKIPKEVVEGDNITIKAMFDELSYDTIKFEKSIYISSEKQVITEPTEKPTELTTKSPTEPETEAPTKAPTEPETEIEETEPEIIDSVDDESSANEYVNEEVIEEDPVVEENPDDYVTVYYTRTGECYHYENPCGRGTYYECTLSEAKSMGLRPCDKCVN